MNQEQIRRRHDAALDDFTRAQDRRDDIAHRVGVVFEVIEASRHNLPGRKLSTDDYIEQKLVLGDLESRLARAERAVERHRTIFYQIPAPKQRKRRTVLVNGVRTKIERRPPHDVR